MNKLICIITMLCASLVAMASNFMVDGLNYTILSDKEVEVNGFNSSSLNAPLYNADTLVLPSVVESNGKSYSVTAIGYSAFSSTMSANAYIGKFTKIVVPGSIKSIGEYAFQYRDLASVEYNEGLIEIGNCAFRGTNITQVTLPKSLISIGNYAFALTQLTTISTVNVEQIGDYAFSNTPAQSLSLGSKVKTIGQYAFYTCKELTEIIIPQNVLYIGDFAFAQCVNAKRLVVEDGEQPIQIFGASFQLLENIVSEGDPLTGVGYEDDSSLETLYIGRQYEAADIYHNDECFHNYSKLVSLTFGGTLSVIPKGSFSHLPSLNSITIPPSVKSVSFDSFKYCPNLAELIILPDYGNDLTFTAYSNENSGYLWNFKNVVVGRQLQSDSESVHSSRIFPTTLESITFNGGFTDLNMASTLQGCNHLRTIDFQCELKSVCEYGLSNNSVGEITLPNTVTELGEATFANCKSLVSVHNSDNVTILPERAFLNCTALSQVHVGDGVQTVSGQAFQGCTSLREIEFSNALKTLAYYSFMDCSNLETVKFGKNVIAINGFSNCPKLRAFYVPTIETWLRIEDPNSLAYPYDLYVNDELFENLIIPQGITKIYSNAFKGCASLKSVDLTGITEIGNSTFDNCINITSFSTGNGINTFWTSGLVALKELTLGTSIYNLGYGQFADADIDKVTCLSVIPPEVFDNTFSASTYQNAILTVPNGTLSDYKSERGWKRFINIAEEQLPDVLVEQIVLTPDNLSLKLGDDKLLNVAIYPTNATNQTLIWSSDNENVAKVTQNGEVIAISEGHAEITAIAQDGSNISASCQVEVYRDNVLVSSISLNPTKINGKVNETYQIVATILPEDADNKDLSWASNYPDIVSVDSNGFALLKSKGTASIIASSTDGSDVKAECMVIVSEDAGIDDILIDKSAYVKIYSLTGVLVYEGEYSQCKLTSGTYVLLVDGKAVKQIFK